MKTHRFKKVLVVMIALIGSNPSIVIAAEPPIVLELFTSQGCSSCPPADALLKQLSGNDPSLIALSFHVHYWDYLGWKDLYSSETNTNRQKRYAQALGDQQIYTPELIVNGQFAMVGSDEQRVRSAIASAKNTPPLVNVAITSDNTSGDLLVTLSNKENVPIIGTSEVWEVQFMHYAKTNVANGENGGRTIENINNVISMKSLGNRQQLGDRLNIPASGLSSDGVAIIVQSAQQGRILGSAIYLKSSAAH